MQLGYELVDKQLFFRKELIERVYWFIGLRWIIVGAAFVASWVAYIFWRPFPILAVTIILLSVVLYNIIFLFACRKLKPSEISDFRPFNRFAHLQISLDLLALYSVIYFTGGIYSPLLIFFIFHIILAGLLLSPISAFVYGISVVLSLAALIVLENLTILPSQPVLFQTHVTAYPIDASRLLTIYFAFTAAILFSVFLIISFKVSLRTKGRELLRVSKELDESNAKLTGLYEMVKEMGLCSDLQALMDLAARNAAKIMGVKACSIKLLDEQRKILRFVSTYGLSEDYITKGTIDIEKSPINRKIIEGSFFTIGKIHREDYFQYPEDIRKEGIASMACLPLRVEKMVLGVFCVYSEAPDYFRIDDVKFFSLMADLTALAIENLKSELNKTWFLRKAAHQLRSPFNAIYSMLTMMRKGYLGSINQKQEETIKRCERRIELFGDLLNDLLRLGIKRADIGKTAMHPVDCGKILSAVASLYRNQAVEKGLDISFQIDDSTPKVMADEKLLDDLFTNLISNAIKYTPPGGKVRVSLAKETRKRILFEVSDTGIGIPEEDTPRLFSEFFRAENAKAITEEGTGLGLVIIKEILDALKGSILVNSKVGEGTHFRCFLPSESSS